jgi:enediyne biosynthesis protein E7
MPAEDNAGVSRRAPGPGIGVLPKLSRLRRDPLRVILDYHREYGDVVRLGGGAFTVHLLGHPDFADHVLRRRHANYDRQTRSADAVRVVTGESLLTNDGEAWRRHRLLMQPAFSHDAIASLAALMEQAAESMADRWLAASGEPVDLAAESMRITSAIASKAFFGADVSLAQLLPPILEETYARSTDLIPLRWLVRNTRRFDEAREELRTMIEEVVALGPRTPLAERLAATLDDEELRNEMLALLLAGHETTANALAWTFFFLASSPELAGSMDDERWITAAIEESMRLYPPVWILERRAIEDDEIGGYAIPAGSMVYVSPYVLHRDPRFWSEPERWDPSRFLSAAPREAWLPFGAGPHHCLGASFAMLEARTIVRVVMRRCSLSLAPGTTVEPRAWVTLRPRDGVRAVVRAR